MILPTFKILVLVMALCPLAYYIIAIFSSWRFFRQAQQRQPLPPFTPPVSNLKPIKGTDHDAYENFASLCRQDYPDYELLFCVDEGDPVVEVLEKLKRDFPERRIRVLFGSGRDAANDKVAKLARLVGEASNEVLVINDSDVRVQPDYLRSVVAPLSDPTVGAVTCFYVPIEEKTFADDLQTIGMESDFYPSILTARQLDGVKFALGTTIATTSARLAGFGGYEAIENQPGDDLLVGRLIAEQGYRVELLPYTIQTVADFQSIRGLLHKRLRWIVVMRHMRPWGHFGLIFTQGLFWSLAAFAVRPTLGVALGYLGSYAVLRVLMTWIVGVRGLKRPSLWKKMPLIVLWDALAFCIWLISFGRNTVRWRGGDYYIRNGNLVPATSSSATEPYVPVAR